jgi:hypothetical protein
MPNFSNTSAPRDFSDLIPKGTVAPMYVRTKRGGHGDRGLLTSASTEKGQSAYLHIEITITDGPYKGCRLWTRLTVEGANHSAAIANSHDLLGSILRSGHNLPSTDMRPEALAKLNDVSYEIFDGWRFIGKVGVERGKVKNDGSGEKWADKNILVAGVTKDMPVWPGPVEQGPLTDGPDRGLSPVAPGPNPPVPPSSIARPSWAK